MKDERLAPGELPQSEYDDRLPAGHDANHCTDTKPCAACLAVRIQESPNDGTKQKSKTPICNERMQTGASNCFRSIL